MSVNSMAALNVSPYLTSAMSRIQSNEQAAKGAANPSTNTSNAAQGGSETGTQVLSDRTLGALVAMQNE
ncbi:MAG TPA: hypothetical protein VMU31_06580 [Rhizomicrobium sp.]|nr:hypothetical protein [Rhizomicrobium sp.]